MISKMAIIKGDVTGKRIFAQVSLRLIILPKHELNKFL